MIIVQTASARSRRIFAVVLLIIALIVIALFGAMTLGPPNPGDGGNQYGVSADGTTETANVALGTASSEKTPALHVRSGTPQADVEVRIDGEKVGTIHTYREPRKLSLGEFSKRNHTYDLKLTLLSSDDAIAGVLTTSGTIFIENGMRFEVFYVAHSNAVHLWPIH